MKICLVVIVALAIAATQVSSSPIETNDINDKIHQALEAAKKVINAAIDQADNVINYVVDTLPNNIDDILNKTQSNIDKSIKPLIDLVDEAEDKAKSEGRDVSSCDATKEELQNLSSGIIDDIKTNVRDIVEETKTKVNEDITKIREFAQVIDQIEGELDDCNDLVCLAKVLEDIVKETAALPIKIAKIAEDAVAIAAQAVEKALKLAEEETEKGLEKGKALADSTIKCVAAIEGSPAEINPTSLNDLIDQALVLLKDVVDAAINQADKRINEILVSLPEEINEVLDNVDQKITKALQPLIQEIDKAEEEAKSKGKDVAACDSTKSELESLVPEIIKDLKSGITTILDETTSRINGDIEEARDLAKVIDRIKDDVDACQELTCLGEVLQQILKETAEVPKRVVEIVADALATAADSVGQAAKLAAEETQKGIEHGKVLANSTLQCIKALESDEQINPNGIKDDIESALEKLSDVVSDAINKVEELISEGTASLKNKISELLDSTSKKISDFVQPLLDEISALEDKAKNEGKDVSSCDDTKDQLANLAPSVTEDLKNKVNDILSKAEAQINGDLDQLNDIVSVIDGLREDFAECETLLCYVRLLTEIGKDITELPKQIADVGKDALSDVATAISEAVDVAESEAEDAWAKSKDLAATTKDCILQLV